MTEHKFRVIKGGAAVALNRHSRKFISAFITDTRLMGVLGLYIHWNLSNNDYNSSLHQFFYFDAEEYGFENYKSYIGDDDESILTMEQALIGGLGGSKVNVSQKEATFLVQKYTHMNKELSLPMPEGESEYRFLLENPVSLSDKESELLVEKLCTPILSDYQLVNYFLMRSYGRDYEGADYLANPGVKLELLEGSEGATLCKNSIEEFSDENGASYLCESLVEFDNKYMLVLSELVAKDNKIASAKIKSSFYITPQEAAMMLNHPEFITVYEVLEEPDDFMETFDNVAANFMQTSHENGQLYLEFNTNNDHVNRRVFKLNEDVRCLYYITFYGQLIIAAYSVEQIQQVEKELSRSHFAHHIVPTSKYEFKEPILYEFIQSDFDDFSDFIDFLNT